MILRSGRTTTILKLERLWNKQAVAGNAVLLWQALDGPDAAGSPEDREEATAVTVS